MLTATVIVTVITTVIAIVIASIELRLGDLSSLIAT